MAFKSTLALTNRTLKAKRNTGDLTIATDQQNKNARGVRGFSLRLGIPLKLLKDARFMEGDRVDLLFDEEERLGLIKRVSVGGWSVGKSSNLRKASIQCTWIEGLPSVPSTSICTSASVTDEGIIFTLPECAVFGRCVRDVTQANEVEMP